MPGTEAGPSVTASSLSGYTFPKKLAYYEPKTGKTKSALQNLKNCNCKYVF